ncbi:MAG: hypothetical protein DIU84_04730, partial [Bacillota bacterium]
MARFHHVTVTLDADDGPHALRLARSRPDRFLLALDADAEALREASARAARKPGCGGVTNAAFVRMPVEALPGRWPASPWGAPMGREGVADALFPEEGGTPGRLRRCGRPICRGTRRP